MQRLTRGLVVLFFVLGWACSKPSPGREAPEQGQPPPADPSDASRSIKADSATEAAAVALHLVLDYTSGERSKDSHAITYRCTIDVNQVTYYGPYGECARGQCEHKEVSFAITPAQAGKLLAEIERLGLFTEFEEARKTELLGHYDVLSLEVTEKDQRGVFRIAGMTKAWGKDASQDLSDEATRWVAAASGLRQHILELVRPHLPAAH